MKSARIAAVALAILVAAAIGYWWGARQQAMLPAKTDAAAAAPAAGERKVLYYRNPMGLPDTSPVPKKDSMGMDYIPVYEGEDKAGGGVGLSPEKIQMTGVRTEAAAPRELGQTLRVAGRVELNERRVYAVTPKFEGWIEKLYVNATGQGVRAGDPLMEVYSPDLVTAQQEYLIALRGSAAAGAETGDTLKRLQEGALARLKNWDISEADLERLRREGTVRRTLTLRSPVGGLVLEKPAVQGMRFMPGEMLFRVGDLGAVWVIAEVPERELGAVRVGQKARVQVTALPGRDFDATVAFVYPTLNAQTRTAQVRLELANPGGVLKPAMYSSVELAAGGRGRVLAVPAAAVIDSGSRRVVLVQSGEGRFEPRDVELGARGDDYVEIVKGVKDGERVVVGGNFLIDSESNLRAALAGFTAPPRATHSATGAVRSIDLSAGTVSLRHDPVPSLSWPAMTMDFAMQDKGALKALKPGQEVEFDFREEGQGNWTVTRIAPRAVAAHKGH
ncbi:efflux RND transporter periplasmic adaptor subunit [Accumulibacter sp.]|uniref:efflux RND transporter periplasmic adaptor subunit n=1 Tax=Accumulibacter sp. TaxID=2053492 RepID=UPI0025FA2832|nr:efflux RND transporter periplasmic adaptor subunit [Accumulibacter sp.]MCM8614081.1 efflux RND transporter periplasmic adaptor subunit [Accumulibacter sp.]MCM8637895.1 efflux RND transporter periplasmic adaptor subunit [Accumulibacter sp.]MCM8641302.1 efflux RND transporter periplasmic adaptor subunit [Accumulibacter sp.]